VAPPGNQAANRENKLQPIVSEETGLLDSIFIETDIQGCRRPDHTLIGVERGFPDDI